MDLLSEVANNCADSRAKLCAPHCFGSRAPVKKIHMGQDVMRDVMKGRDVDRCEPKTGPDTRERNEISKWVPMGFQYGSHACRRGLGSNLAKAQRPPVDSKRAKWAPIQGQDWGSHAVGNPTGDPSLGPFLDICDKCWVLT